MLYKRGNTWWVKWYKNGVPVRESAGKGVGEKAARALLRRREGDVERGVPVSPKVGRISVDEALAAVVTDYRVNGKRSLGSVRRRIALHLEPFFRGRRMANVQTDDVQRYVDARQGEHASNATINRELAALKRAYSLCLRAGSLVARPYIAMLKEAPPRAGFFESDQVAAVRRFLPPVLQNVLTFAIETGWRTLSEVLPLEWRRVDFDAGTVRLDAGTTKNGAGRLVAFTRELRALLIAQRAACDAIQRERGIIVRYVFTHEDGRRIRCFRKAWRTACRKAGIPDRLPHDCRRTAIRNLERAGVPRSVAMAMVGHKTESVYRRYDIVSESDLHDAAKRLDAVKAGS
jgi:integrase